MAKLSFMPKYYAAGRPSLFVPLAYHDLIEDHAPGGGTTRYKNSITASAKISFWSPATMCAAP